MAQNSDTFLDGLVADLQPVRPLRQRTGMVRALLALMAGPPLLGMAFHLRRDLWAMHPDPMFLVSAGLFLVLALASAWAAVDMARPWVGTRREGWGWSALMASVLPLGALALALAEWLRGETVALDADGFNCLTVGCAAAVLTLAVLTVWLRRGAASNPRRAGLVSGVAAGAAGVFAVSLFCPHNELLHIGFWHAGVVFVMGLVGLVLVPRLIRW